MSDFDRASYPPLVIDLRDPGFGRKVPGPSAVSHSLPAVPGPLPMLWMGGSRQIESARFLSSRIRAAGNENAHPVATGMGESPTPESEGSDHATA